MCVCLCSNSRASRGGNEANNAQQCAKGKGARQRGREQRGGGTCQATKFCAAKLPHSEAKTGRERGRGRELCLLWHFPRFIFIFLARPASAANAFSALQC